MPTLNTFGVLTLAAGVSLIPAAYGQAMPVAEQNALIQKHCAVCHTDAIPNGGLSLQHFDAANADPGEVAMVIAKMKTGAFGAAGIPMDRAKESAIIIALSEKTVGAGDWTVHRTQDLKTKAPLVIASMVQSVPAKPEPDSYRLKLTCRVDTHEAEMLLAWSPGVPPNGQSMSAAVDGKAAVTYKIEGQEKMGNGTNGSSGPGSIKLTTTQLPAQNLTISNAFPNETVVFPFAALPQAARQELSTCFASR